MTSRGLSPLQVRILRVLASTQPPWTLTGGGALALCYLGERETRDLDLLFLGQRRLDDALPSVTTLLEDASLEVA